MKTRFALVIASFVEPRPARWPARPSRAEQPPAYVITEIQVTTRRLSDGIRPEVAKVIQDAGAKYLARWNDRDSGWRAAQRTCGGARVREPGQGAAWRNSRPTRSSSRFATIFQDSLIHHRRSVERRQH